MSKADDNKAIVGRWFSNFWGKTCDLSIVDEIAAPDMLLHYSLHEPRRGRDDIKAFMTDFRRAFPDLNFWGAADLITEGDYVVEQARYTGTHTGPLRSPEGVEIPPTGKKFDFPFVGIFRVEGRKIRSISIYYDQIELFTQLGLMPGTTAS